MKYILKHICPSIKLKRNLNRDIRVHIIDLIKRYYTIQNVSYSIIAIVMPHKCFEVVIQVNCFDYVVQKKVTGYFSLDYLYSPCENRFFIASRHSRSISEETKLAANIPCGGWNTNERTGETNG